MDATLLTKLGLTDSQAKTYLALVGAGRLTPPGLAKITKESRTAAYMALAKLEELGLARRTANIKKQTYEPVSPAALERHLEQRRQELTQVEETFRNSLSEMLSHYYEHRKEPGVRFFQGEKGLVKVLEDHLKTGEELYFIRTLADEQHFGKLLYRYMDQRAKRGITSHGLAPFNEERYCWAQENDRKLNRKMSWYPPKAYTAPVEVDIYGSKVSFISFGEETIGTIIESPQIAHALREVFNMAKVGAAELMRKRYPQRSVSHE